MIKIIAIVVLVLVAGVLVFAATKPDTFRVQRTASINASAERIFPLINDLHRFNTWNPYEKKDPAIKGSYSGTESGKGARYAFDGNKDVGKGSLEITESAAPTRVAMQLRMTAPMQADNNIEFTLERRGTATSVTWSMHGGMPFVAKLMSVFVDMDKMIGKDFETGLANLKAVAEG
jgi:hypothetical protein